MSKSLQPVRGTYDLLPEGSRQRAFILNLARNRAELYGFGEIQTPIFEFSEVFHRTLGDTSDVVTKETYTFADRGGESLTLRPELTASVVRAFISGGLQQDLPCKFFYAGPAFRYERPQKGRFRQFHQFGAELLGVAEPLADVEMIALAWDILGQLGLRDKVQLQLNSLGDAASRDAYRSALIEYFTQHQDKLSDDSKMRLAKNPLRILDSKDEGDRKIIADAPKMTACFTPEATAFFAAVTNGLEALGIPFTLNDRLVRGLDYYNHTVFEFIGGELGAQNAVLSGGRYDGLVETMGGQPTPGIGWGAGFERLELLIDFAAHPHYIPPMRPVALVPLGEVAEAQAMILAQSLRAEGIAVDLGYKGNMQKRMKRANKVNACAAVILGEDELKKGVVSLKDLDSGQQSEVKIGNLAAALGAYF
jgi:histidyl-tRNA synthetase